MQSMGSRDLVGRTRNVSCVVVAVTWLVVTVCEDGQMTFGVSACQLGLGASVVESLAAGVELEVQMFLGGTAYALGARVALAAAVLSWKGVRNIVAVCTRCGYTLGVALVFWPVLVLFVAAVAFGVVRLGLACTTTVLALLDGTTLGIDVV